MRDNKQTKSLVRRIGFIALIIAVIIYVVTSVVAQLVSGPTSTPTSTEPVIEIPNTGGGTPNPNATLLAALHQIDQQFESSVKSSIAYNVPKTMKVEETIVIELLINPSMSQGQLATLIVERGVDRLPITGEHGQVEVVTSEILIQDVMKAVLTSEKPGAFEIQELHDDAKQLITTVDTTKWRWSVTAKEPGEQTLELVLYRLITYTDEEYWREVETYNRNINVEVSTSQWIKSLDWRGIITIFITALLIPIFFRWYDNRKKTTDQQKQSTPSKQRLRRS
jgi:hypothetical protein